MTSKKKFAVLLLLALLIFTCFSTIAFAASSDYSFVMYNRVVDGSSQGIYHTLDQGNVYISGLHYEISTDPWAVNNGYNSIYYALVRERFGPDYKCGSASFEIYEHPSGLIGVADMDSSNYYLEIFKIEDDGHNIMGSGEIYN